VTTGDWLMDYLTDNGGTAEYADIKRDGAKAGHSIDAVKRARSKHRIKFVSYGKPRRTRWEIPGTQLEQPQSVQPSGESALTALTALTVETRGVQ